VTPSLVRISFLKKHPRSLLFEKAASEHSSLDPAPQPVAGTAMSDISTMNIMVLLAKGGGKG
jgi:hypothetical protein